MPSPVCPPLETEVILAHAPVGTTIGAGYLGVIISAMIYGITCCQAFHYFRSARYKHDHWVLKLSVALLWFVTGVQEALIIHCMYWYLVTNFSDACTFFSRIIWSIPAEIFVNTPLRIGVEAFLLHRTWILGRNRYTTSIFGAAAIAESVLNTTYAVRLSTISVVEDVIFESRRLGIAGLLATLAAESLITATLVYYLHRNRTGFRRSNNRITGLIVMTISTGGLTTLVTLAELMTYLFVSRGFYVIVFTFVVGKLYLNCMLTALNVRSFISDNSPGDNDPCINSFHPSRFMMGELPQRVGGEGSGNAQSSNEPRTFTLKCSPEQPRLREEV